MTFEFDFEKKPERGTISPGWGLCNNWQIFIIPHATK